MLYLQTLTSFRAALSIRLAVFRTSMSSSSGRSCDNSVRKSVLRSCGSPGVRPQVHYARALVLLIIVHPHPPGKLSGRSRLPLNAEAFPQRMKILNFNKEPPDSYFPVAHTCFFQCELPAYSTIEIMRSKLRYAIFNCTAIDGDDTGVGMAAAAMGWEE